MYMCFIDFNKVRQDKLFDVLRKTAIDANDLKCIKNLYSQQKATVRLSNGESHCRNKK